MNSTPMLRSVSCIAVLKDPMCHFGAEGDDGDGDQREHHGDERSQEIENFVDMRREHVFFGEQLDDVGEGLEKSVGSDAARADAKLDVRDDFSLDPLQVGERGHQTKATTAALMRLITKKFIVG